MKITRDALDKKEQGAEAAKLNYCSGLVETVRQIKRLLDEALESL